MKQLGQIFKRLREARHISLADASSNDFSPSMLSKFENGKNEISALKLFTALENTHIEVNEYLYLARGFSESSLVRLQEKILESELSTDYQALKDLYHSEIEKWEKHPSKANHKINSIIIKAHMKGLVESTQLTEEENTFLHDYLFITEIWGNYGILLASLRPYDYFSQLSIGQLLKVTATIFILMGLANFLHLPVIVGLFFLTFAAYLSRKINPKINALLLSRVPSYVLARTSNFLSLLFTLSIPLGTGIYSLISAWNMSMTWLLFTSTAGLITLLSIGKGK
ncbi:MULTISPECIES: Rgg/GadR/MutR family transcriptional regulator [Aerococcus]|uniref:Rgg/GadR/MutR family transcriptional regulator n=1 Tax=Aerococcus TaxID=1375 RepID=UPI000DCE9EE1|nr:Rgg/GadR/MutR family transcriptional regulator [Aerococcus urinae]MDK7303142.1 hypothetical protein [Aerococcus urinae]RAV71634.1 hypothetical protein DBT40_04830 [Aerococcus urinae]RAW04960.1 hypothetical protein DBT41_03720 [Aerococcus urinae]